MKKFKKEDYRIPVHSWCDDIEDSAMKQIDNLARLPFAECHVAIMSDCHTGYGSNPLVSNDYAIPPTASSITDVGPFSKNN